MQPFGYFLLTVYMWPLGIIGPTYETCRARNVYQSDRFCAFGASLQVAYVFFVVNVFLVLLSPEGYRMCLLCFCFFLEFFALVKNKFYPPYFIHSSSLLINGCIHFYNR